MQQLSGEDSSAGGVLDRCQWLSLLPGACWLGGGARGGVAQGPGTQATETSMDTQKTFGGSLTILERECLSA